MHGVPLKQNVTGAWFPCPICGTRCRHPDGGRMLAEGYRFHLTAWHYSETPIINAVVSGLRLPARRAAGGKPIRNARACPRLRGRESITPLRPWRLAQGGLPSDKPRWGEELVNGINIICKQLSSHCSFRAVLRSKGSLQSVISPITIKIY